MTSESASTSSSAQDSIFSKIESDFKIEIIKDILKLNSKDKGKISEDALILMKEITKVMVVEAAIRAAKQATVDGKSTVTVHHIEAMLVQMMLDFP